MRLLLYTVALSFAAFLVNAQEAKTIKVNVGADGLLTYNPANLVAPIGTKVEFHYFPKNHTVTQSSFKDPCHPLEGGFFSGFVPTIDSPSKTTFTIEIKDTKPIWFYCGQANHCQKGMIGAINAPTTGNTFESFSELAKKASNSTSPASGPVGGVLSNGDVATPVTSPTTYTSTWTSNGQVFTTTATVTVSAGDSSSHSTAGDSSSHLTAGDSSSHLTAGDSSSHLTTWAYTTKLYTSTWTSNGQPFSTIATTTLLTTATVVASAKATSTTKTGAAPVATGYSRWHVGALVAGVAAMV